MTARVRPLSLIEPQIGSFLAGTLFRLRRPFGHTLANARPGDLFWIREPFHLPVKFKGLSPSAAAGLGARPVFVDQLTNPERPELDGLGPRQFARALPRVWHRQYLIVIGVHEEPLHRIMQGEIRAEGFPTRAAFAAAWDRNLSMQDQSAAWRFEPLVAVIDFHPVPAPLPPQPERS